MPSKSILMWIVWNTWSDIGVLALSCNMYQETMEKAIKNKVAKAVVPAIDVMFQAVRYFLACFLSFTISCTRILSCYIGYSEFGTKVIPPKKILKMLPELFDHQDQNVRASAKGLTIELCRWIGKEPVKSILFEKMRDTMVCHDLRLHIFILLIRSMYFLCSFVIISYC